MTPLAPLGETPSPFGFGSPPDACSLLASPLLPKGEANAKGEDSLTLRYRREPPRRGLPHRSGSPMPNTQCPIPNSDVG
ncbi:MAG: hypothetical protein V7K89_30480 [Nostoc sp.]|uniref:hypothetical protein n=1 Tax=Nostoc sp. TaxID=1180 RepID=UPI002FF63CFC